MLDPKTFREVVRSVTVSYPIPFLVACLFAVTLACFGLGAATNDWLFKTAGCVTLLCGCGYSGYAIFRRPELLRSERHSIVTRAFTVLLDKEVSQEARSQIGKIVEGALLADAEGLRTGKKQLPSTTIRDTEDGDA